MICAGRTPSTSAKRVPAVKILAIETTAVPGSIALAIEGRVVASRSLPDSPRAAASLAPSIRQLLQESSWRPMDIALVAVTVGPGPFTSVRIGVVTAKVFAYAAGAEVVGVNAFDAVAARVPPLATILAVIADAQRGQVVGRAYRWNPPDGWCPVGDSDPIEPLLWLKTVGQGENLVVTGPGLHRFGDALRNDFSLAPKEFWDPRAETVAELGWKQFSRGQRDSIWTLKPIYYRPSYAEEKRSAGA